MLREPRGWGPGAKVSRASRARDGECEPAWMRLTGVPGKLSLWPPSPSVPWINPKKHLPPNLLHNLRHTIQQRQNLVCSIRWEVEYQIVKPLVYAEF